jgi:dTDP-4-amino-4,6-dideoxygalactose transaminase
MSDLIAAIRITQFGRLEEFAHRRRALAQTYNELLAHCPRIIPLNLDYSKVVPHIYVVRIKNLSDREGLCKELLGDGIQT